MIELKKAWEKFLEDSDDGALLQAIKIYSSPLPDDIGFPYAHRIKDICLKGKYFRVVRIADEIESIYIYKCGSPSLEAEGVPYWLSGEKLQYWIRLHIEAEQNDDFEFLDAPTNWDIFR